eukprot:CAMPEP_0170197032 /NCGR_PEP_ID=MMETSP0040_2-20121228/65398_1 /TAXON_ID=641309 /ORGANISM="Lotharella oceanica, Strain CCMP622" /LENGTH=438 /DNA_ID=CAMNT_0010446625 /DNA_START=115 /DNA_END=1432 /DNA_ORIENTATION=+
MRRPKRVAPQLVMAIMQLMVPPKIPENTEFWRALLPEPPLFFTGLGGVPSPTPPLEESEAIKQNGRMPNNTKEDGSNCFPKKGPIGDLLPNRTRCGWCHLQPTAVEVPLVGNPRRPHPNDRARALEAESAKAIAQWAEEGKVVVLKLPDELGAQGDRFHGNARHNQYLHRAVSRAFGVPSRNERSNMRVSFVMRSNHRKQPLPPSPDAPCRPRRLRNLQELRRAFRHFCAGGAGDARRSSGDGERLCEFRMVDLGTMSGMEQQQLAAATDVYIAYHGSAIAHSAFLPDDSIVVEVYPRNYFLTWWGVDESENTQRNVTWVFATANNGKTTKCAAFSENDDGAPNPGWFCQGPKDSCRAWNPTIVMDMLRHVFRTCTPRRRAAASSSSAPPSNPCLREAMVEWQKLNAEAGEWVFQLRGWPSFTYLEIPDDGVGVDDTV